jgi:hypothetical protein
MLPSLVHLRESRSTSVGCDGAPPSKEVRTALVTIEHQRSPPTHAYKNAVGVYGSLRITVRAGKGSEHAGALRLEPVWANCFHAAAMDAYDVVADLATQATEAESEMQKRLGIFPAVDHQTPIDRFYYRGHHLVAIPQNAPNLQPQEFLQRDYGPNLSFVRNVIDEATENLLKGVTLLEVSAPYDGAAQDVDVLNEEMDARDERANNMEPAVYYDFRSQ